MEYKKIMTLLDDTTNQPSESRGTYNASNQIKFKTSMIRSNLCDYSNAYINVKGNITDPNTGTTVAANDKIKK